MKRKKSNLSGLSPLTLVAIVAIVAIVAVSALASAGMTGAWGFGNWGGPKVPDKVCHKLASNHDQAVQNIVTDEPYWSTQICLDSGQTNCYRKNPCTGQMDSVEYYLDITGVADYRYIYGNGDARGSLATSFYTVCEDGRAKIYRRVYAQGLWARYIIDVCDTM